MELAAWLGAVATGVAAARLDLVDRAFDQFADLENLPQLAAILRRQITNDLSLVGGGIGHTHGRTHGFWLIKASRKADSVTMHFHGTRFFFRSPEKKAGVAPMFYASRAAPCETKVKKGSDSSRHHCADRTDLRSLPGPESCVCA
jgi:hypothetical protein